MAEIAGKDKACGPRSTWMLVGHMHCVGSKMPFLTWRHKTPEVTQSMKPCRFFWKTLLKSVFKDITKMQREENPNFCICLNMLYHFIPTSSSSFQPRHCIQDIDLPRLGDKCETEHVHRTSP